MIIKDSSVRQAFDITGRALGTGIASATVAISAGMLLAPLRKLGWGGVSDYGFHLRNAFSNIVMLMINIVRYYFGNNLPIQPAAVIAGFPLGTVEELSHAMSDLILKFRATGGIFLAHQEGGEQTLRIVGKAWGRNRYLFLTLLDLLFLYGSAKLFDMFSTAPPLGVPDILSRLQPSIDPWAQFDLQSVDEGREERHLTFPVITTEKVYANMYIETYDFDESIENGLNVIQYTIFFRKYIPSFSYKYQWLQEEDGTIVWYYAEDTDDEMIRALKNVDLALDIGFTTAIVLYRFFSYLAGNSEETNIAYLTGIGLNQQSLAEDYTPEILLEIYPDLDYNLAELSITQKEEMMQID